jgi:hypothetical protein
MREFNNHDTGIVDSGGTRHLLLINALFCNKTKFVNPLRFRLLNGDTMDSTHRASLDIPELSEDASVAHFPQPWQSNPCFQSDNYAMKVTMSLLKLTALPF